MPHDANNEVLTVGDIVSLDCRVTAINPQEDYCNVTLETIFPPNPPTMGPTTLTINARQVIKNRQAPATNASSDAARDHEPEPNATNKAASINR